LWIGGWKSLLHGLSETGKFTSMHLNFFLTKSIFFVQTLTFISALVLQFKKFKTCNEWVESDPDELKEAYWKIRGVYVYEREWQKQWS